MAKDEKVLNETLWCPKCRCKITPDEVAVVQTPTHSACGSRIEKSVVSVKVPNVTEQETGDGTG